MVDYYSKINRISKIYNKEDTQCVDEEEDTNSKEVTQEEESERDG